ncbi:lamin-C-like [Musca autumnalis]|uniref:lamin-C-like n=1 Tax=Musca autumnalis TaxID=221902 RepID=UPI003CEDF96C
MVRFGKFSRVAPKEVKVTDYEEINGKWVPKLNTREVDSNSIRKIEQSFPGSIDSQQGSLEETSETKNENVCGDVSRMLKVKVNQLLDENKKLKTNLEYKSKDWQVAEEKAQKYESRAADLSVKYQAADADRKKAVEKLGEVQKESECLRKQLDEARKYLNAESMIRTDLQNRIQSLRDELTFKEQNHLREIDEIYSSHQLEISVVHERLCEQYKALLQQSLQELREQHEGQMRKMKMLYEQKIKDLQAETNRESVAASRAIEEVDVSHQNIESLYIRISKLESTNAALNGRNCDLEKLLANERRRHASEIAKVDAELQQLQESVVYEKLLYDEEVSSQTEWAVTSREYDIEISKGDPKARVQQKGTNEVQIDGGATVSQRIVTDTAQEPPAKIMMNPRKWKSGENIKTTLYNANEEVAGADRVKRRIIRHVSNHRIINEESSSAEKNPLRRKWIYHVFHRGKRSPHPSWLLKVLGAIT